MTSSASASANPFNVSVSTLLDMCYDLFRVENGKIAEHWDTIERIPAKAEWKNQNGKF